MGDRPAPIAREPFCAHIFSIMTFWQFLIFFGLAVFVLWNIWFAIRSLGDIGDDD